MGFMDVAQVRQRLAAADLDGLLLLSPLHVYYATGYASWFLDLYGAPGYGAASIPADTLRPPAGLVCDVEARAFRETAPDFPLLATYPVWIADAVVPPLSSGDAFGHLAAHSLGQPTRRAGIIDVPDALLRIAALLREQGLDGGRVGTELGFITPGALALLQQALPACRFVDATALVEELRAVKSPREIALLRRGTELTEAAIRAVVAELRPGMRAAEIARRYRAAAHALADDGDVLSARITLRAGPEALSPRAAWDYQLQAGDVVMVDAGVDIAGYRTDMGRTFVLGRASAVQRQIYGALRAGFEAATALLRPGIMPGEVFQAGMDAVHAAGMRSYVRGNLGHGIGMSHAPERPMLCREEALALAAGQVLSVELPYYIHGLGAFQIEDSFVLTGEGAACFNQLSRELVELG